MAVNLRPRAIARGAPVGAEVRIFYDPNPGQHVRTGHALVTVSGRVYVVVGLRRQQTGKHVGRLHLRCVVADYPPPPGARVHPLVWYPRERRHKPS